MSSTLMVGGIPHGKIRFLNNQEVPRHPIVQPMPTENTDWPKSASLHGQAMKVVHFAGRGWTNGTSLQLEREFIRSMSQSNNPAEKATIADILGRVGSMNAVPHLLKLMDEKEAAPVRIAAAKALTQIGNATNEHSYTRTRLSETMQKSYRNLKSDAGKRMMSSRRPATYADRMRERENQKYQLEELQALVTGVSSLKTADGMDMLKAEYHRLLDGSKMLGDSSQGLEQAIKVAQEKLKNKLQSEYQRPIKELLQDMPPEELKKHKREIEVHVPGQEPMNLLEALRQLSMLQKQSSLDSELLLTLVDALAQHDTPEVNTALKEALASHDTQLKAKVLDILGGRNELSYNSDIHPNLSASDSNVRKAALTALLASKDPVAKQKTLELIQPKAYFEVAGISKSAGLDALGDYVGFLIQIAARGDEYVQALSRQALTSDYDLETRQLALATLNLMTQEPISDSVSKGSVQQARSVIRMMAIEPPSRTSQERDALSLAATQMWVGQKDPQAITAAIMMANSEVQRVSPKDQEALLNAVLKVLIADEEQHGNAQQQETQRLVANILAQSGNPLLTDELKQAVEKELADTSPVSWIAADNLEQLAEHGSHLQPNVPLVEQLQPNLDPLRPILASLMESDKSFTSRMLVARIVGLLRQNSMVDLLIDKVRNPLKGQLDWSSDRSYRGNPALDSANMRLNAMYALGDIGDAKALDVLLDFMNDNVLRDYGVTPAAKLAKDANAKADDAQLAQVREKLMEIVADPDVTRAGRAVRIKAANALFQYKDGVEDIKKFAAETDNPNFKRHVLSVLLSNDYALDPSHPDHDLIKFMTYPGLGVERLHAKGITGKDVEMAIIDGGYVDKKNQEAFQDRVKLPANARSPESTHPTMVFSTAASNGKLKGVAPDAIGYSNKWPDFQSSDPMSVYKDIIAAKLRGENNIRVINNSWGFSDGSVIIFKDVRDLLEEFKAVVDMAEKADIQMVFAAGNSGEKPGIATLGSLSLFGVDVDKLTAEEKVQAQKDLDYILDKVVVVGALNTQGSEDIDQFKSAEFTSVGDAINERTWPTVMAPGVDMMVSGWNPDGSNPRELVNGTSFASPFVTGLITLMLDANSRLTPAEIREILTKTATKLPKLPRSVQGAGVVNPEAAVAMAESMKGSSRRKASKPPADEKPATPPEAEQKPPADTPDTPEEPGENPAA